jgi:uncharacterized protein (DUF427 family)
MLATVRGQAGEKNMETQTTRTTGRAVQVRVEQGAKRVRAYLGGGAVADTTRPRLVWEDPYYPAYYFLVEDVRTDLLVPSANVSHARARDVQHYTIKAEDQIGEDAARRYADSPIAEALRPH